MRSTEGTSEGPGIENFGLSDKAFNEWHMEEFGVPPEDNAMAAGYRSAWEHAWQAAVEATRPRCGARIWPYTERNTCILDPHVLGDHRDSEGRDFSNTEYR